MTDAQKKAKGRYKARAKRLTIDFWPTELDLAEWVSQQPAKQTYIKRLIRLDMQAKTQQSK